MDRSDERMLWWCVGDVVVRVVVRGVVVWRCMSEGSRLE